MLTRDQLLKPKRATRPLHLAEYDEPLTLGAPSGLLSLRLRELRQRGVSLQSEEALELIVADMVVSESGTPVLSREDARAFLAGLSPEGITALIIAFGEMGERDAKGAGEPVPSRPSTSAT